MSESHKDWVTTAMDCGEILSNLISNVLDVSKIQAQMFQPMLSSANPRSILHKIFNINKSICVRKGLTLILEIDRNLPKFLMLDETRFSQVLINIISNSIKFTDQGFVKITVTWKYNAATRPMEFKNEYSNYMYIKPKKKFESVDTVDSSISNMAHETYEKYIDKGIQTDNTKPTSARDNFIQFETNEENFMCCFHGESEGNLIVEVEDSGIGISEGNLEKLFTPFVQANAGISNAYGGTGLGLWISKTIMQVYQGDVTAASSLDKGSVFTIQQPCKALLNLDSSISSTVNYNKTISALLLDNHFTKENKRIMERHGISVTICMSAIIAAKYLEESNYNIVFVGSNFLTSGASTLIAKIKAAESKHNALIIILAHGDKKIDAPYSFQSYLCIASPVNSKDCSKVLNSFRVNRSVPRRKQTRRVLVLDDDHFILSILSKILENEQIPHQTYSKGTPLIELYKENYKEIGLILLDANMNDISGYDVAKAIRNFEEVKQISGVPIICVSGDSGKEHTNRCREAKITSTCKIYIVTKPIKREEYLKAVNKYLH